MKIDFKNFKLYLNIEHSKTALVDAQEQVANIIYNGMNGIAAHALALKIYNAKDVEEYNDNEIQLLKTCIEQLCKPSFIDSFNEITTKE